jgi:hypothetical protein
MIVEQAKSVAKPVVLLYGSCKHGEKFPAVIIRKKDGLPSIATGGYMIHSAGIFYS